MALKLLQEEIGLLMGAFKRQRKGWKGRGGLNFRNDGPPGHMWLVSSKTVKLFEPNDLFVTRERARREAQRRRKEDCDDVTDWRVSRVLLLPKESQILVGISLMELAAALRRAQTIYKFIVEIAEDGMFGERFRSCEKDCTCIICDCRRELPKAPSS